MKLTVIDTPGFGDQINNENWYVGARDMSAPKPARKLPDTVQTRSRREPSAPSVLRGERKARGRTGEGPRGGRRRGPERGLVCGWRGQCRGGFRPRDCSEVAAGQGRQDEANRGAAPGCPEGCGRARPGQTEKASEKREGGASP